MNMQDGNGAFSLASALGLQNQLQQYRDTAEDRRTLLETLNSRVDSIDHTINSLAKQRCAIAKAIAELEKNKELASALDGIGVKA